MFSEEISQYSWDEITHRILAKTDADVRNALSKAQCSIDDFMALISPAAAPYIEQMAQLSRHYTQERFVHNQLMYQSLCVLWFQSQQSYASHNTQ